MAQIAFHSPVHIKDGTDRTLCVETRILEDRGSRYLATVHGYQDGTTTIAMAVICKTGSTRKLRDTDKAALRDDVWTAFRAAWTWTRVAGWHSAVRPVIAALAPVETAPAPTTLQGKPYTYTLFFTCTAGSAWISQGYDNLADCIALAKANVAASVIVDCHILETATGKLVFQHNRGVTTPAPAPVPQVALVGIECANPSAPPALRDWHVTIDGKRAPDSLAFDYRGALDQAHHVAAPAGRKLALSPEARAFATIEHQGDTSPAAPREPSGWLRLARAAMNGVMAVALAVGATVVGCFAGYGAAIAVAIL